MIDIKALERMNPFFILGQMNGEKILVLKQLRRLLGPLPEEQDKALERISRLKFRALGAALLDVQTPGDLTRWLQKDALTAVTRKSSKAPKRTRKP